MQFYCTITKDLCNMNKIGFKNFRRFLDFPDLEYGGVTLLVGKNNSGKSTFVKALMLIYDYLQSDKIETFSFGSNNVENVNIVTFGRALNANSPLEKI
jgi:predicted ATP-dependent endonuclease of OLD family